MKFRMILKYTLTALSAMFFMLAGTGYNVAKYCCHHCEIQGIEHIMEESCSHEMTENMSDCCTDNHSPEITINHHASNHTDSCELVRFTLDQFSVEDADTQIEAPSMDLFGMLNPITDPALSELYFPNNILESPPLFHPFCDGKNINIFKSVYLI